MRWPVEFEEGPGPAIRSVVVDYINERGLSIFLDWSQLADRAKPSQRGRCLHFHAHTEVGVWSVRAKEALQRHIVVCDNCGIIEDRPENMGVELRIRSGGWLEQDGVPAGEGVVVALRMGCQDDRRSVTVPWPKDADGGWQKSFLPTSGWVPGVLRIKLIMLSGASLGLYTITTRSPTRLPGLDTR